MKALHRDRRMRREQCGGLDQSIGAVTVGEADVVPHGQVVEPRPDGEVCDPAEVAPLGEEVALAQDEPDPHPSVERRLRIADLYLT
jgi:hypothetical protein